MLVVGGSGTGNGGSTADLCLADPKPERLKAGLEPGKTVRLVMDGAVREMRLCEDHADVSVDLHGLSVRPDGKRRSISDLIERHQKETVR